MPEPTSPQPKKLSGYETVKEKSNYLRGTLKQTLESETTHFSKEEGDLLKPHGTYQQDDRDKRQEQVQHKKEPLYSMMVRTKIPGGRLTADQYLAHDELATKYGNGTLRITDRQGFQFHGVLKKNLKTVIRKINECLVTTLGACGDNVRNVMACPAPLVDRKKTEILRYTKAISDQFLARGGAYYEIWLNGEKVKDKLPKSGEDPEPIYGKTYLPRKFKIALAFLEDNCTDIYTNDIGIVPEIKNGELNGFNILVGGGLGMTHGIPNTYPRLARPFCFVKPDDILALTKAIVLVQRDFGNRSDRKRARMKYLIDERGLDWFRAEVEKRFGKKTEPMHPIRWKGIDNHLGWHPAADGRWFYGLSIENGRVKDNGKLKLKSAIRAVVEKYKPEVYLTAQQDMLFSGFQENQKKELENLFLSFGVRLSEQVSNVQKDSMACPALPTCGLAITEAERIMPSVIDELEQKVAQLGLSDQKMIIRMTGCPNGCARPYNAEIGLVGRTVGTYNIYVGGNLEGDRLAELLVEKVPQKDLMTALTPLLETYKTRRRKNEGIGDFCFRLGVESLRPLIPIFAVPPL